jgi:lysozyme
MKTSKRGVDLIKEFEGFRGKAYLCPAGVPTIGWGTTKGVSQADVQRGRTITRAQAEKLLLADLVAYEDGVDAALTVPPTQHQFDACVSMAYNIGVAGFRGSSVAKAHNRGDMQAASRAFALWDKATVNGKKVALAGLTRRRAAEAALYLEPMPDEKPEPMPQAVEPERPMSESHINRASVVAGGTAGIAATAEVLGTVNSVKMGVEGLGQWLVPLLLLVTLAAVGWTIYERFKQREAGVA